MPFGSAGWRRNPGSLQLFHDLTGAIPFQVAAVNRANDSGFVLHNLRPVLTLPIPQEVAVGQGNLPLGEALPHAPRHIFGDGHALVLRHSRHDRKNEAALGIECVDIFLLEYALDAVLFELTDCGNAVNNVPSEPTYALRQNQRKLARQRVVHHLLKTVAMAYPGSAHTIIVIASCEFVIRAGCEQFLVMRPLVFQAVLLLIRAR